MQKELKVGHGLFVSPELIHSPVVRLPNRHPGNSKASTYFRECHGWLRLHLVYSR
jgi:hypothetical protein